MRALRELEPPSIDEGWAQVQRLSFARTPAPDATKAGVFVAAKALERPRWREALSHAERDVPHLVFDWHTDGGVEALDSAVAALASVVSGPVAGALCPHGAGPPSCWCRPPLPGLPLAFARSHGVDPARSTLVGSGPAHRTLAAALGARHVSV
jgi:hypothetical protein